MMYPGSSAQSNIGALLRLIQEEKASNLAANPPSADVSSPLRGVTQEPLKSPEAPGTSRMVSIRPEDAIQSGPQVSPMSEETAVPPVAPIMPAPIAPIAPSVPGMPEPQGMGTPQMQSPMAAPQTLGVSAPRIAPQIAPGQVAGISTNKYAQPTQGMYGGSIQQATPKRSMPYSPFLGAGQGAASLISGMSGMATKLLPMIGKGISGMTPLFNVQDVMKNLMYPGRKAKAS